MAFLCTTLAVTVGVFTPFIQNPRWLTLIFTVTLIPPLNLWAQSVVHLKSHVESVVLDVVAKCGVNSDAWIDRARWSQYTWLDKNNSPENASVGLLAGQEINDYIGGDGKTSIYSSYIDNIDSVLVPLATKWMCSQ